MIRILNSLVATTLLLFAAACGRAPVTGPTEPGARPVTALTLATTRPDADVTIVGVARPYREERIGFEVGGRVIRVVEVGTELSGPDLDADDRVLEGSEGEAVARLDTARFEQALRAAQLSLASAERGLAARRIEADIAGTSELEQARAQEKIAEQDLAGSTSAEHTAAAQLERRREEFAQGIASQAQLDTDQSSFDSAGAKLESARHALDAARSGLAAARSKALLKQAQVEQVEAEIEELGQRVAQAELDLSYCTLRAPFSGRVTEVQVARGGFVQPGAPVVTLTAMDPIKVSVTVSAERSRDLLRGQRVTLRPRHLEGFPGADELVGIVFAKSEVADQATRTHRIDIMARNLRRSLAARDVDGRSVHGIDHFMPVIRSLPGSDGPLFVGADCLREEDGSTVVYRLPLEAAFAATRGKADQVLQPERVPVKPGAERLTMVDFRFVSLADATGLHEGDALISDPRPEHLQGVTLERFDWALRPGDLVSVDLSDTRPPAGIYVPVDAIVSIDGRHDVFVIDGARCRRATVTVHESVRGLRRIVGDGITDGARIARQGAHYLADGDRVTVVDRVF